MKKKNKKKARFELTPLCQIQERMNGISPHVGLVPKVIPR